MTKQQQDNRGYLQTGVSERAAANERLVAYIFEPESSDEDQPQDDSIDLADLKRICNFEYNKFNVPNWYSPEDHFQDVQFRFWKFLSHFRGEAKPSTAAHNIARNQLVDVVVRKKQREDPSDDDDFIARIELQIARKQNVNRSAELADRKILMKELASSLTNDEYSLYWEYFVEGRTEKEISSIVGITPQAVHKRLGRVLAKMKSTLSGEGWQEGHKSYAYSGVR